MLHDLPNPDSQMVVNGEYKCHGHHETHEYPDTQDSTIRGLADAEFCSVQCVEAYVAELKRINFGEYGRGYEVGRKFAEFHANGLRMRLEDELKKLREDLQAAKRAIGESQDLLPALTESLALARRSA